MDREDIIRMAREAGIQTVLPAPKGQVEALADFAALVAQRKPLTEDEVSTLSRAMVKGDRSVNWLCRAIEKAHGIGGEE